MAEDNWLDAVAEDESAWLDEGYDPALPVLVPRHYPLQAMPKDEESAVIMLQAAWDKLTRRQQIVLDSMKRNSFNLRETVRKLSLTNEKTCRTTIGNWMRENDDFRFVHQVLKAQKRQEIVDPETLLLRANLIADMALEPKPILHQGRATGFYENNLGHALSANEQLMKATGMLKSDKTDNRVVVRIVNLAGAEEAEPIDSIAVEVEDSDKWLS